MFNRKTFFWILPAAAVGIAMYFFVSPQTGRDEVLKAPEESAGRWQVLAPMPTSRTEVSAAELGGKIYVAGGLDALGRTLETFEAYDVAAGTWLTRAPLPMGLHHTSLVSLEGKIYAVGGFSGLSFEASDKVFEYDPATDKWTEFSRMPLPRGAAAAVSYGKSLAVFGGSREGKDLNEALLYDFALEKWISLSNMPTSRDHQAAGVIGGTVFVVGGRHGSLTSNLSAVEAYDPSNPISAWSKRADMPTARGGIAAAVLDGKLYVFGGESLNGTFRANEVYDPVVDSWQRLKDMPTGRHGLGAAAFNGKIYAIGGGPIPTLSVSNRNEVFIP